MKRIICASIVLWIGLIDGTAYAHRIIKYNLRAGGPYPVDVKIGSLTVISFPVRVMNVYSIHRPVENIAVRKHDFEVTVIPLKGATPGNIEVKLEGHKVGIPFRLVDDDDDMMMRVEFVDEFTQERWVEETCEKRFDRDLSQLMFNSFRVAGSRLRSVGSFAGEVEIKNPKVVDLGGQHKLLFEIVNHRERVFTLEEIQVFDQDDDTNLAAFVGIRQRIGIADDIAFPVDIPTNQRVSVFVALNESKRLGRKVFIQLIPSSGLAPAPRAVDIWPPSEESTRGPLQGRMGVSASFTGGTSQIEADLSGQDVRWVSIKGAGARILRGLSKHMSVEGVLDISGTGRSVLADVWWDESQGDLLVSETRVGLQAGALVHTGERWIRYARAGLGARFTEQTLEMGNRREAHIRAGADLVLGSGVNWLIKPTLMVGFSASLLVPLGGNAHGVSAVGNLHIGTLWGRQ